MTGMNRSMTDAEVEAPLARWEQIAQVLEQEVAALPPGTRLPSRPSSARGSR